MLLSDDSQAGRAYVFFRALETFLNAALPGPRDMASAITEVVWASKVGTAGHHKAFPEGAFLNQYVLPTLYEFVSRYEGMDPEKAHRALLSESYKQMREYASGSPARWPKHPFGKVLGVTAPHIVRQWKSRSALIQSCPDLALRAPFPYRTVFEAKYFRQGKLAAAETALATNIYQAFFYRGLAKAPARGKRPAWDYDYACVLAYDATESGTLLQAWKGLRSIIGKGCWEGAGIYVMILRGASSTSVGVEGRLD